MRKIIIDTDTGSDDAVALMIAMAQKDLDIIGITTVSGNVDLEKATLNALQTVEVCGREIPVYKGAARPLFREPVQASYVHGFDGMGDNGLIHPTRKTEEKHAVEFILDTIRENPGEVEIIALGPATNIALAILKDRELMKKAKYIWSMGTAGYGRGNSSPVAEFNVFSDAESYAIMLEAGIPMTIAGFDLCEGDAVLADGELEALAHGGTLGEFTVKCTAAQLAYNAVKCGHPCVTIPDAVIVAAAVWPEVVLESETTYCYCCTKEEPAYGQVIIYDSKALPCFKGEPHAPNATVIKKIDNELFKKNVVAELTK